MFTGANQPSTQPFNAKLVDQMTHPHEKPGRLAEELTHREREVLRLMTEGLTTSKLPPGYPWPKARPASTSAMCCASWLSNRTQAVLYALQNGW